MDKAPQLPFPEPEMPDNTAMLNKAVEILMDRSGYPAVMRAFGDVGALDAALQRSPVEFKAWALERAGIGLESVRARQV